VRLLHDWQRTFRKYMDDYKTTPAPTLSSTHRHLNNNDITGNGNGLADKQSADLLQGYTQYCESNVTRNMNTINASIREILNNLNLAYKQLYHHTVTQSISDSEQSNKTSRSSSDTKAVEVKANESKDTKTSAPSSTSTSTSQQDIQPSDITNYIDTIRKIQEYEQSHMALIIEYQSIIHQHVILYHNEYSDACSQQSERVRQKLNDVTSNIAELSNDLKYSINGVR